MNAFNHDLKDNIDQTERSLAKVWPRISIDKARRIPLSTQDATSFAEKQRQRAQRLLQCSDESGLFTACGMTNCNTKFSHHDYKELCESATNCCLYQVFLESLENAITGSPSSEVTHGNGKVYYKFHGQKEKAFEFFTPRGACPVPGSKTGS